MTSSFESLGQPQAKGTRTTGREDVQGGEDASGSSYVASSCCGPRKAGVVIRASVEHVGLAGDTELTVNVKWPAGTFSVQPCEKPVSSACQSPDAQNVPSNGPDSHNFGTLIGEVLNPAPYEEPAQNVNRVVKPTPAAESPEPPVTPEGPSTPAAGSPPPPITPEGPSTPAAGSPAPPVTPEGPSTPAAGSPAPPATPAGAITTVSPGPATVRKRAAAAAAAPVKRTRRRTAG
jgi:hypothetical protein